MNVFIYALTGMLTLVIAARTLRRDPTQPLRLAFARLAMAIAGVWLCFCAYLLLDTDLLRLLRGAIAIAVPFYFRAFLDALLGAERRPEELPGPLRSPALPWGFLLVYLGLSLTARQWDILWLARGTEVGLGTVLLGLLCVEALRLLRLASVQELPLEQGRLRNLLVLMGVPVILLGIEAIGRFQAGPIEHNLDLLYRAVQLQGVAPPTSAILATVSIYILSQAVSRQRMLDLDELILVVSRGLTQVGNIGAAAAALGAVTLIQVGPSMPGHSSFQAILAVLLGLLALDPVRGWLEGHALEWLDRRGQRLREAMQQVDAGLARVISTDGLADELLGRLVGSGRIRSASLYLWEGERGSYRLNNRRGEGEGGQLERLAGEPLRAVLPRRNALVRPWLEVERRHFPNQMEEANGILRILDGMRADAALPLRTGETLLGWLVLSDGDGGGFSVEEMRRLEALTGRVSIILENLHDFERLKEMHRLAALGTMAAGLAHEIRNPLAGIKGAAQYLQTDDGPPDGEMVQVIVDEVDRLNGVVTQFLDYARPLQLNLEPVRLDQLIAQVASLLRAQGLGEVRWEEDILEDLPTISVDAPRLKQVLLNLCQNAVQAIKGDGTLRIRVRSGRFQNPQLWDHRCLELAVEDSGPGIQPSDLDQIFVPFFTTRADGTGLGLPICQRIVQAHRGELDVQTTVGKGSVFTVRLPLENSDF